MPLSTNQRAEASSASVAGRGAYPSSSRARVSSKAIWDVDMRAASSGTEGWRWRRRPSTVSDTAATASESARGTLIRARGRPGDRGQLAEQLLEGEVLAAEDVAAAVAAALEREQWPAATSSTWATLRIVSTNPGMRPFRKSRIELAGRRRGPVARSEREGRQDDRRGQALGDGAQDLVLGDVLRALVRAVEVAHVGERPLVRGRAPVGHVLEPECADGARVDEPLDAGLGGRAQHVASPPDVDGVERRRVAGPEAVQRRDVEHGPAAAHDLAHVLGAGAGRPRPA